MEAQTKTELSADEIQSRGVAMAKLVREIELKEEKRKQDAKELGDEIKELEDEVRQLAKEINDKAVYEVAQMPLPVVTEAEAAAMKDD